MPRIPHWALAELAPAVRYRNTETNARAVLARAPQSFATKWRAVIVADEYPVWVRGFGTKEITRFRDALRKRPAPELVCRDCGSRNVARGEKAGDGGAVQRWYDCRDCGFEAPSRVVYAAER